MSVYNICGHGAEPVESIIVPVGCTIVVKANPGCYMSKYDYDKHLRTIFCNTEISSLLGDPASNVSALRNAFGPVSIFKAGDRCPNFRFRLMVDFPENKLTNNFSQVSGIIPLPTTGADTDKLCNDIIGASEAWLSYPNLVPEYIPAKITNAKYNVYRKMMNTVPNSQRIHIQQMVDQLITGDNKVQKQKHNSAIATIKSGYIPINMSLPAKNILPSIYEHSIYPTKEDILEIVNTVGENSTLHDVFADGTFEEAVNIDLKTLFAKYPGTYYHFACRLSEDPSVSEYLFANNVYETNTGSLVSRPIPAIYNRPVMKMPNEYKHYIKQAISEAERRKHTRKGRKNRKTRRKSRHTKF